MIALAAAPTTYFAPAERADEPTVHMQSRIFAEYPLLHQLLDAVPDIFLIVNQQRQIVFANATLLNLLGTKNEHTLIGLRPGEALHCVHSSQEPGGCGTSEFCRTCGAAHALVASLGGKRAVQECRITQKDGSALDLRIATTPFEIDGQRFSIFAVKDISSEKRRRALERIFFHDIMNTAGTIAGFSDLLLTASPEEVEQIKGQFSHLCHRLIDEINAQKALAAAENNELSIMPMEMDALALLIEVRNSYAAHEIAQGRSLEIGDSAQPALFVSDYTLLRRVLGNMVKNALEASKPGETVTLTCGPAGGGVCFRVHNPAFIPRHVQLQIFQRSFSTKGSGRGLGTYSMKLLTERYLQGTMTFETSPKKGTTFTACYPFRLG